MTSGYRSLTNGGNFELFLNWLILVIAKFKSLIQCDQEVKAKPTLIQAKVQKLPKFLILAKFWITFPQIIWQAA